MLSSGGLISILLLGIICLRVTSYERNGCLSLDNGITRLFTCFLQEEVDPN